MKRRQILIADSGSTKTDWAVLEKRKDFSGKAAALSAGSGSAFSPSVRFRTEGINPFYQDDEAISRTLAEACRELRAATAARDGGEETVYRWALLAVRDPEAEDGAGETE